MVLCMTIDDNFIILGPDDKYYLRAAAIVTAGSSDFASLRMGSNHLPRVI